MGVCKQTSGRGCIGGEVERGDLLLFFGDLKEDQKEDDASKGRGADYKPIDGNGIKNGNHS